MQLLSYNSPLIRFFERVFELVVLNLLTILLCVPLVTAGAAVTALYRTVFDMRQQKGRAIKGYLRAFRAEFRPALALGLLSVAVLAAFGAYLYLLYPKLASETLWAWIAVSALGALFFFPMTFLFPLFARFQNTAANTIVNAFFLSLRHLPVTLAVLAMQALPACFMLIWPAYATYLVLFWLFFGVSLPAFLAGGLFLKSFSSDAKL